MLKNVKESAINDERLATVFFINNRLHGLYCFFLKAIAHSSLDGHSQLRTMADGLHGFLPHAKVQRVAKKI